MIKKNQEILAAMLCVFIAGIFLHAVPTFATVLRLIYPRVFTSCCPQANTFYLAH